MPTPWSVALKEWNSQSGNLNVPHSEVWAIPKRNTKTIEQVRALMPFKFPAGGAKIVHGQRTPAPAPKPTVAPVKKVESKPAPAPKPTVAKTELPKTAPSPVVKPAPAKKPMTYKQTMAAIRKEDEQRQKILAKTIKEIKAEEEKEKKKSSEVKPVPKPVEKPKEVEKSKEVVDTTKDLHKKYREEEKDLFEKPNQQEQSKRDKFYSQLMDLLNSKSTQQVRSFKKANPDFDSEKIYSLIGSQKGTEFYPTPEKCLNKPEIIKTIETSNNILEVGAGLGNIANFIVKHKNYKTDLTLLELNNSFIPFLKQQYPYATVKQGNFLDMDFKNNTFDTIFSNPPFGKFIYYDFLIRCLNILTMSESKVQNRDLIFICPKLTDSKFTDYFEFEDVVKKIGFTRMEKIMNDIKKPITKDGFKLYIEGDSVEYKDEDKPTKKELDDEKSIENLQSIAPFQCGELGSCKEFGGTNVVAYVYRFVIH